MSNIVVLDLFMKCIDSNKKIENHQPSPLKKGTPYTSKLKILEDVGESNCC